MAVRSDRLFGPIFVSSAAVATLFTVPGDQTWLLKTARYLEASGSSKTFYLDADPGGTASLLDVFAMSANQVVKLEEWLVFEPGVTMRAAVTGSGSVLCWGWGARLTGSA